MKKKVSILEIVATKIVIALLVAGYYWMWSRSVSYTHLTLPTTERV